MRSITVTGALGERASKTVADYRGGMCRREGAYRMAGNSTQNEFEDTILICVQCHEEFVFTASAQQYFAERGFHEPPKRCKACYTEFKHNGRPDADPPRQGGDKFGRPDPPSPPRTAP